MKGKRITRILSFLLASVLVVFGVNIVPTGAAVNSGHIYLSDLRIELLTNPLLVENLTSPAFSWVINSDERGTIQTAYQIQVFDKNEDEYWDSGKIISADSSGVKYSSDEPLQSASRYTWRVKVWDNYDNESPWSEQSFFTTALKDNWQSETESIWAKGTQNWAFFRKEFTVQDKPIEKIIAYATGLEPSWGRQYVFRMTLNGDYVGVGPTRHVSEVSNKSKYSYNDDLFYNAFDITDRIEPGSTNVVGAICCNGGSYGGMFSGGVVTTGRAFMSEIHIQYEDGEIEIIGTDKTWKSYSDNAIFGTNTYHGGIAPYYVGHTGYKEYIRGDLYPFDFDMVGFDDTFWDESVPTTGTAFIDKNKLVGYSAENMIEELVEPVTITKHTNGNWIVDYGQTVLGGIIISINPQDSGFDGSNGGKYVEALLGEVLYGAPGIGGTAAQAGTVKYQAANDCTFQNRFYLKNEQQTMRMWGTHTFRYAEFVNLPDFVNESNFTDYVSAYAMIYPADFSISSFETSNNLLDEIYEFNKNTLRVTNYDVYVDCPNRERLPYEADAYIQMLANYATNDSYALARHSAEHLLFNPTWPVQWKLSAVKLMYEDYLNTGDNALLIKYYDTIQSRIIEDKLNLGFDETKGIVNNNPGTANGEGNEIMDYPRNYVSLGGFTQSNENIVSNAWFYDAQNTMSKISEAVGNDEDAAYYSSRAVLSKQAINEQFFSSELNAFRDGLLNANTDKASFLGQTFVTAFGASTDENGQAAAAHMASYDQLWTAPYASAFAIPGMFRYGQGAAAMRFVTGQDEKGNNLDNSFNWRYMIEQGSGSAMEGWNDGDGSHSHPWGASPAYALPNGIMGIEPLAPAFASFQISPTDAGLEHANVSRPTIRGVIDAAYRIEDNIYKFDVTVPGNTTAHVYLPVSAADMPVTESGVTVTRTAGESTNGVTFNGYSIRNGTDVAEFVIGSGTYQFGTPAPTEIILSTTAHNVNIGDYFDINTSFKEEQRSNTVVLNYTFDGDKFVCEKFQPASGVSVIDTQSGDGFAKITLMIQNYNAESLGYITFKAKTGAILMRERQYVQVTADYVLKNALDQKYIYPAKGSVAFTTIGDGSEEPVVPGDTNDDGIIDLIDLSNMIDWFGIDSSNPEWDDWYTYFDFNNNGSIDISDISAVAQWIE